MYFGVDYYPEQWPRERWETDLQLMKEAGLNLVRVGGFSWSILEPEEGRYDFSWLDEVIKVISSYDLDIVLELPISAPPAWMLHQYPDILPVTSDGRKTGFGAQRHYTVNSRNYRDFCSKTASALAERYGSEESVVGWQLGNETVHLSYGKEDQVAFQSWLERKYETLEKLNEHWGTVFWNQTYSAWEQIHVPAEIPQEDNPSMQLDFNRFWAETHTNFNNKLMRLLREQTDSRQFITHNLVYSGTVQEHREIAEGLDVASFHTYPVLADVTMPRQPAAAARKHDLCRGTKQGKSYWVTEELSGAPSNNRTGYLPRPGHLKLWTYQAIARGAEAVVYFRWRAALRGTEQLCQGILDHDGMPRRKYNELKEMTASLQTFADEYIASDFPAEVGFYHNPENEWAWQIQPQSAQFSYEEEVLRFYEPAHALNIHTDMIQEKDNLSAYKVLIVPVYFLTKPALNEKLKSFAEKGGTIIFTYRTGVKNSDNAVHEKTLPGELASLCGIEIHEYEALPGDGTAQIKGTAGPMKNRSGTGSVWADYIEPAEAEVLAVYEGKWFEDKAAVTKNSFGKGTVYYIGCGLERGLLLPLYEEIFQNAGLETTRLRNKVELVQRETKHTKYLAVLNHNIDKKEEAELPDGKWKDTAGKEKDCKGRITLAPLQSIILKQHKS
ncbi:beta-galactosidase [Alkalicoccus daliensis]|uniref:Beta-galactosidase n=1 Tax=Alkalicoccus daliensis TaxID=745820 RepID=A0A1H0J3G9_9BACI|nr:beta-galactosidase [Alkalicoccus daliensis]SDO38152.1 beta-galactosidase [Alkalicoccus daliensis]